MNPVCCESSWSPRETRKEGVLTKGFLLGALGEVSGRAKPDAPEVKHSGAGSSPFSSCGESDLDRTGTKLSA